MRDVAAISAVVAVVSVWAGGLWRLLWRVAKRLDGCERELRSLARVVSDLERTVWTRRPAWVDDANGNVAPANGDERRAR